MSEACKINKLEGNVSGNYENESFSISPLHTHLQAAEASFPWRSTGA